MGHFLTIDNNVVSAKIWQQAQRLFYDSREHKRMWHTPHSIFVENVLDKFFSYVNLDKTYKILEIGCGAGRYTIPLVQRGYNITGIDISKKMIDRLKEDAFNLNLPQDKYRLIYGDFKALNAVDTDKFDAVIGFNILHHLSDILICFCNIAKIIKKGGITAFVEPNGLTPLHYIDSILDRSWKIESKRINSIPSKVKFCMEKNNFHKIEYLRFGFFPPFLIEKFPALLNVEKAFEKFRLFSKALTFFIIKGENA